jgi:hypothetical protein
MSSPPRPIPESRIPFWHLLPFGTYLALNAFLLHQNWHRLPELWTLNLQPFQFVILGLATYRIANIIANEQVTKVFRAPFILVRRGPDEEEEEVPKPTGLEGTIGSLLYCPSCVGVWIATGLAYLLWLLPTFAWFIGVIFALSAVERLMTEAVAWLKAKSSQS